MGRIFLLIISFILIVPGCSRKAVVSKYYLLETSEIGTDVTRSQPLVDAVCEIMPMKIHPAFAGTRIAVRMDSHELLYYTRHQWAVNPDESLLQLTERGLQNRNLFSRLSTRVVQQIPEYRIQIEIHRLEAIQDEEELSAHLVATFSLIENPNNRTLVSHICDKSIPLEQSSLNLFAAAISDQYYTELQRFADKIESYLETADVQDSRG